MQTELMSSVLETYGPLGVAFVIIIGVLAVQGKRIKSLENNQREERKQHLQDHKELIADYVELVKSKILVIEKLSSCLSAIKGTLDRMERQSDK